MKKLKIFKKRNSSLQQLKLKEIKMKVAIFVYMGENMEK